MGCYFEKSRESDKYAASDYKDDPIKMTERVRKEIKLIQRVINHC